MADVGDFTLCCTIERLIDFFVFNDGNHTSSCYDGRIAAEVTNSNIDIKI